MTLENAAKRLNQHKIVITLAVLIGAVLAMGASLLRPIQYSTSSTFIVIQEQRFSDPYAQARSAEYLAGVLARIVDTDSFRRSVFERTPDVRQFLPADEAGLRKTWRSDVTVQTVADTGIVEVAAFQADPAAARAVVEAVGAALTSDAGTYLGTTAPVKLLQIDGPVTSQFPVRPNLPANMLAGALVGFAVAAAWLLSRTPRNVVRTPLPVPPPAQHYSAAAIGKVAAPSYDRWLRTGTGKAAA